MDHQLSKEELIALLGNCILALAFLNQDFEEYDLAYDVAEQHAAELDRRFPGWKEELQQG